MDSAKEETPLIPILSTVSESKQDRGSAKGRNLGHIRTSNPVLDNVLLVTPIVYFFAVFVGSLFYRHYEKFSWPMAVYFSVQSIMGIMYGEPEMKDPWGQAFTSVLFILGMTIFATALGTFAMISVSKAAELIRSKVIRDPDILDDDQDGVVSLKEYILYGYDQTLKHLGWHENRLQYVAFLIMLSWFSLGVAWGRLYESYGWWEAIYFASGGMICSGWPVPKCEKGLDGTPNCSLGLIRAAFVSVYLTGGIPLFYFSMSQFADLVVRRATKAEETRKLTKPINKDEFQLAATLIAPDRPNHDQIDFAQFIVIELLRLERVKYHELKSLRYFFEQADLDNSGYISMEEVKKVEKDLLRNLHS